MSILPFLLLISITIINSPVESKTQVEVKDYFLYLNPKDVPLYLCRGYSPGILWRIPPKIECPLVDVKKESRVVELTFWWTDITKQSISGFECYRVNHFQRKSFFFFGSYSNEERTSRHSVTAQECKEMAYHQRAPNKLPFKKVTDGVFSTQEPVGTDYSWPYTTESNVDNYLYINIQLSINNKDDTIITISKVIEECKSSRGNCLTENGILIWETSQIKTCRLKQGKPTACLVTDNRLSCPELNLAATKIRSERVCGRRIGYSDQGLMFTPNGMDPSLLVMSASTSEIEKLVNASLQRTERDITINDPRHMLDVQINGNLQYLYDLVKQNISFVYQALHRDICRSHALELEMLRALAEGGQSSITVRALMNDGRYRSTLQGDVLSVIKCTEIFEYMFLPQSPDNCTLEYKLEYMHEHVTREGYLQPLSHEIKDTPTQVPCPAPSFLFDIGHKVILLSNYSHPASHIPYLPSPCEGSVIEQMPDISFNQPGIYSINEITGEDTILGLLKQLQQQSRIDRLVQAQESGRPFSESQMQLARAMRNIALDPMKKYFIITITMFITILFIYILFTVLKIYRYSLGTFMPWLKLLPLIGTIFKRPSPPSPPFYQQIPMAPERNPFIPNQDEESNTQHEEKIYEVPVEIQLTEIQCRCRCATSKYPQEKLNEIRKLQADQ